ncbi:MAG: Ig-like domain-containing protein [Tissierellaceae bacterium]|nr:Ig-like domain-containing protein [Tissierellaceae bacterium]
MVKRLLAALLLFVILLSALAPVLAATDYDNDGEILKELGVLTGNEDGDLMLNDNFRRQDMVVMISRLYKEENKARNYVGKNIFRDLNAERKFYIPYITWAKDQGLIQGQEKDEFGFNAYTTVQEFQTVLLRALGYSEEAQNWNQVPELAKSLGLMDNLNLNPSSRLRRGQMATMVLNTLRETKKGSLLTLAEVIGLTIPDIFKVDEKLTINNDTITLSGKAEGTDTLKLHIRPRSSGISGGARLEEVVMDRNGNFLIEVKNLQEGSYEYRFEGSKKNTVFKTFDIENVSFELVDIVANNLKEITLKFTRPVDTSQAVIVNNYTTTAGAIKEVRFEENNKEVILVLNGIMTQQNKYKINANVKSEDGQELKITNEEFQALDNTIPEVLDIVQLGNKGLKVVFSEPIKGATSSNFRIDGKTLSGSVNVNNNEAILTFYSSLYYLTEGKHTLTLSGIVDFADYPVILNEREFTIVKDLVAPKIIDASATLEEVTIEFDEDIDPVSAIRNNFYFKIGTSKRYPDSVKFDGKKATLSFKNNILSTTETTIYVENVTDYSGNKVKSEVKVTPVIDTTPPQVISYNVAEDGRSITVIYSKNVHGTNRSSYSIKDQSGRTVYIREIQGSGREFTIYLSTILPVGTNTLTIQSIQDTTPLKNVLIPYSVNIDMKDVQKPEIANYSGFGNYIMIQFNKEMDYSTVTNPDNYYLYFSDRTVSYMPTDSLITLSNDNKSVTILLPETISGKKVVVGQNLTSVDIRGLKDTSGNDLKDLIAKLNFDNTTSGKAKATEGVLLDENTIRVEFNIPIIQADMRDFSVTGRTIDYIDLDGTNIVTLYLNHSDNTSIPDGALKINSDNKMQTYIQTGVEGGTINLVDKIAPRVKYNTNTLTTNINTIELPFTEELEAEGASLYRRDLEIYREEDGQLLSTDDYTTSLKSTDKSVLLITITNRSVSSYYSVRVIGENNSEPSYIRDAQGNLALDSIASYRTERMINR